MKNSKLGHWCEVPAARIQVHSHLQTHRDQFPEHDHQMMNYILLLSLDWVSERLSRLNWEARIARVNLDYCLSKVRTTLVFIFFPFW